MYKLLPKVTGIIGLTNDITLRNHTGMMNQIDTLSIHQMKTPATLATLTLTQ